MSGLWTQTSYWTNWTPASIGTQCTRPASSTVDWRAELLQCWKERLLKPTVGGRRVGRSRIRNVYVSCPVVPTGAGPSSGAGVGAAAAGAEVAVGATGVAVVDGVTKNPIVVCTGMGGGRRAPGSLSIVSGMGNMLPPPHCSFSIRQFLIKQV